MDDLLEVTKFEGTLFGAEGTTHNVYSGQNRWCTETWTKRQELDTARYGVIWLEEEAQSHKLRAVKRVRKKNAAWGRMEEISAMARLRRSPQHFAYMHGWFEDEDWMFIAMDYFELGDLSQHLRSKIPESQARQITEQLLRGLVELHDMGITHRDLKPANIFVVSWSAPYWDVRIGDFGISKLIHGEETELRTMMGTRQYMAPELDPWLVDDEGSYSYTNAVDIWSLGILLFQMLTLELAFSTSSLRKYFKGRGAFPQEPLLREHASLPCIEFIRALLQPSPDDRPTSKDALSYDWIGSTIGDPDIADSGPLLCEVVATQGTDSTDDSADTQQHQSTESAASLIHDKNAGKKSIRSGCSPGQTETDSREQRLRDSPTRHIKPVPHSDLHDTKSALPGPVPPTTIGVNEDLTPLLDPLSESTCPRIDSRESVQKGSSTVVSGDHESKSRPTASKLRITVIGASGLHPTSIFFLPNPFAEVTVDGGQRHTTSVIKKTLNPCWNESFDLDVTPESIIAVNVLDKRRFLSKHLTLMGRVWIHLGSCIELEMCRDETLTCELSSSNESNCKDKVKGQTILKMSHNLRNLTRKTV